MFINLSALVNRSTLELILSISFSSKGSFSLIKFNLNFNLSLRSDKTSVPKMVSVKLLFSAAVNSKKGL